MLSDANKIKIAIIGLGKMGHFHLNALRALQKGEFENYYKGDSKSVISRIAICGVCDISPDIQDSLLGVQIFADYHELICMTCPDIVIVATPTQTHFDIAKFALEKGANVFVEKPIVVKRKEFKELLALSANGRLKLMAGHVERYNPVSIKLREILSDYNDKDSKKTFYFSRIQPHDLRIDDDIVVDKLIHDLDLAIFLFGEIRAYKILEHKKVSGKVQELRLYLENNNCTGEIFVSWLKGPEVARQIKLEYGGSIFEGDFLNKTLKTDGKYKDCKVPRWVDAQNNQIKDELVDFVVHCFSKSVDLPEPLLNVKEIAGTVKIVEEISEALKG